MNWSDTALTRQLRIRHPIIQAPMAGGPTTPELVAAVSNAGALGSLGAGILDPEEIRVAVAEIRALTDRPFAVNLFAPSRPRENKERMDRANARLAPYRIELDLPAPPNPPGGLPDFGEQLSAVLDEGVEIVSFTFGVPGSAELEQITQRGGITLGTATHLLEAIVLEECGVDMVVAQGMEAGGHRGGFLGDAATTQVGTLALVPLLADHLHIPLVAAGGIMDGRGIAAALALGACGAQMGTAFLACPESGAHPAHKEALRHATETDTRLTRAFSGRHARGLKNRFIQEMKDAEDWLPDFPLQQALTADIRATAARAGRTDFMALWAGQGCPLVSDRPAAELIERWMAQLNSILGP